MEHVRTPPSTLHHPRWLPWLSVVLLALLASGPSLVNGFVYDDRPIILTNARVHTLARWWTAFGQAYWPPDWGDTNYRPLTILSFAVQWAIGDGSPAVFHAVNVALYVAACTAVFWLARMVLPATVAWIVAALFAAHPVHVEAVGNVVGQAELVVAICTIIAVGSYLKLRATGEPRIEDIAKIAALYAIACFSKETGFFLVGLLLAAEFTVVAVRLDARRRSLTGRVQQLWPLYAACAVVAIGYLAARRSVLGGFGDDPNTVIAMLSHEARLLTMLSVVPEWVRLLLWPARLSADYSPAEVKVVLGLTSELIAPALILAGIVVLTVAGWRGRRVGAFGLVWVGVALFPVSNIFLRSGVIIAERTLFLPSVGAVLAVGAALFWISRRAADLDLSPVRIAVFPVSLLLALGVVKSATRQRVWRSADDFHRSVVEDAPRSYRAQHMHGMWHFRNGRRAEGERHVRTAIALFPHDAGPYIDLADQYREGGLCAPARALYRRAIDLGTRRDGARFGLVACLLHDGQYRQASIEAQRGVAMGGPVAGRFKRLVAIADSAAASTAHVQQSGAAVRTRPHRRDPRL